MYVATSLTIGYDAPWRQIHALLLLAAERTPGLRATPKPVVRQTALQDFYVQYTLMVSLQKPQLRGPTLDALHANIQDAFNEYGVQIMSPNYEPIRRAGKSCRATSGLPRRPRLPTFLAARGPTSTAAAATPS